MDLQADSKSNKSKICSLSDVFFYVLKIFLQRKYPDATDYAICSLIGGFFFLRFINPAIVTPQAYMLVEGVPAKHPRRTLTLASLLAEYMFHHIPDLISVDCEDAPKPSEQAVICQGGLHEPAQSLCGEQ